MVSKTISNPSLKLLLVLLLLNLKVNSIYGQSRKLRYSDKTFQLSFFSGISTNGIESGHSFNKLSINIFSGISAGNKYLELGGVSNVNTQSGSGLQLAGLANIIGSNTYLNLTLREERQVIKEGFSSDFRGIQFSGLINYVRDNAEGFRISGGLNLNGKNGAGFQAAGLVNMVGGHFSGFQIAGLSNVALKSTSGVQLAGFNHTNGQMNGFQIGIVNKVTSIKGNHSPPPNNARGFQIGLVNLAETSDGTQLGFINIGKKVRGTQIGLINVFKPSPYSMQSPGKNSTPIGLINIGSNGSHSRLYMSDLFLTNFEHTTGSCYNCAFNASQMPVNQKLKVMNQNALIFAHNPLDGYNDDVKWGFGYGFQKVMYTKSSMAARDAGNHKKFISIGGRLLHLNRDDHLTKTISLLSTIHAEVGIRIKFIHVFAGLTINNYLHRSADINRDLEFFKGAESGLNYQFWPGYTFGLHLF